MTSVASTSSAADALSTPPVIRKRSRGRPGKGSGSKRNRNRGRFGNRKKFSDASTQTATIEHIDMATNTGGTYDRLNPRVTTFSGADDTVNQCAFGYDRLKCCTPPGFHWTAWMIVVLLRYVFFSVCFDQNSLHGTCEVAAKIFCIKRTNVSKLTKMYLMEKTTRWCMIVRKHTQLTSCAAI